MSHNQATTGVPIRFTSGAAELAGTLYEPTGHAKAAVVLNSATGVPQDFYRHFAHWLATERGMVCLTYDYRDFGRSGEARGSHATMVAWALEDQPAARAELRRRFPGVPLWVIGHSLGAMLMPLQQEIEQIDRLIGVASGLVHHSNHPWPYQALARLFWFGHVPLIVPLTGYVPGRISGFGVDLPAGVYRDWKRWCTTPESYLPETGQSLPMPNWGRCNGRADMFAFADDPVIPPGCVWRLSDLYEQGEGVQVRRHLICPKDLGLKAIGHLGAFARRNAAVWPVLLDS